ncbi:aromatic ring-hydroxylating oxygenase subunit alpha [Tenacibaculum holothuriorum]|nr:aromatic ring-hydroxylating dioxygenase subunit alpha [Tenacibaculum holothuriorum]
MKTTTEEQKLMPVLPVEAYTSQEWYNLEMEHIFGNTWQFAGLIEDVANPGDFVTVQCGSQNIMVVKGKDQRLRAFHNICRHKGTQLLRSAGKAKTAITCPYHAWTYSLQGELQSVPDEEKQFPNLDKKKFCLHKAQVETWRGMVFVHPDPKAEPLHEFLCGFENYISPYHKPEELQELTAFKQEHVIHANWKLVAENYMDVYHLNHLHSKTLFMFNHDKASFGYAGPHYTFVEPVHEKDYEKRINNQPISKIKGVDSTLVYVPMIFPNIGLAESQTNWSTFHIIPLAPNKCKVVLRTKVQPMSTSETIKNIPKFIRSYFGFLQLQKLKDGDPMESYDFVLEDNYACEQQQKALQSKMFSVGASAEVTEAQCRQYQQIIKDFVEGNRHLHKERIVMREFQY